MSKVVQRRRGTTAEHTTFTGALGELTVDTTKDTLVVHDGAAAGGFPLLREDGSNSALAIGSAGTPSLKFTGDPNTGLYSPGADQVAISTGGTGRLFVDSAGNVGIGTNSPTYQGGQRFTVRAGSIATSNATANSSNGELRFIGTPDGVNYNWAGIRAISDVNVNQGVLAFFTSASNTSAESSTERLRITSAGNVGIGTSSPSERLDLGGGVSDTVKLRFSMGGNVGSIGSVGSGVANGLGNLAFFTRDGSTEQERLRITSNGNVGIGTSSPGSTLTVAGDAKIGPSADTNGYLTVDGATNSYLSLTSTNGYVGADSNLILCTNGTGTERARIDSAGRLLVGTSAARTNFRINVTNYDALQQVEAGSQGFQSLVGGIASAGGPYFMLAHQRSGAVGGNTAVLNNDELGVVSFHGSDGTNLVIGASVKGEVDGTPGTNDMPGRLVFATTADGAAGPTEQLRITNGGTVVYNQPAPAAVNTTATLMVANLTAKIITSTTAAAVTMTLPTGTDMDAGFASLYTNMAFEWSVINTGATNAVTVQGGTGHTVVGSGTVAASNSGRFVSRRTAATTWVTYRLSS